MPEFYTVLVVDDDSAVRTAMRQMLERQGYAVHLAQDGPEALEIAQDQPPDLILCDYR
ncbi:MAG: response regulator, partial [Candidatus Latescibacteria bacterium]|nr:response regulator [Candidatus Latescibacterota bacterium]